MPLVILGKEKGRGRSGKKTFGIRAHLEISSRELLSQGKEMKTTFFLRVTFSPWAHLYVQYVCSTYTR